MQKNLVDEVIDSINKTRFVYFEMEQKVTKVADKFGVTSSQLQVLWILTKNNGVSMTALAKLYYSKVPTMHGIIARMKKSKLVVTKRNGDDLRTTYVFLTAKGEGTVTASASQLESI